MTSIFNVVYPPANYLILDGGLNSKYNKATILDNESPDCLNVVFNQGSVETRGGSTTLNTTAVGSFACDGLYTRHTSSGNEYLEGWFAGSLQYLSGTTFSTVTGGTSVFTSGNLVGSAEYEDYRFYGDGTNIPYKMNGTLTRHGVYPPTTTFTIASATTGSALSGVYSYKLTYVNTNLVESDVGPVSNTLTIAAGGSNILITSLPVAPSSWGIESRRIYRTEAGGADYKLAYIMSNNTATTWEDNIADISLGVTAPTDQGVPPKYQSICYHQGRLFCIDPEDHFVKWSEIGNPYVFKATSFIRPGDTTGDTPVMLEVFDNSLLIGCKKSMWMVYMPSTDPTEWQLLRIKTALGTKSPFAHFRYQNRILFAATDGPNFVGFAAIAGQTTEASAVLLTVQAVGSEFKSDKIQPLIDDVKQSLVHKITASTYKNTAYIAIPYESTATYNNRILVFDYDQENLNKQQEYSWSPWSGINASFFTPYNSKFYCGSSDLIGTVKELLTSSYDDDGVAINSYIWTKEFFGGKGDELFTKDWRFLNIFYELVGDYLMNVYVRQDSTVGDGDIYHVDLDPGGTKWGTMIWGIDNWNPGATQRDIKLFLGSLTSKRIQVKFTNQNTVGQGFKVIGLTMTYNKKGRR